VTLLLILGAVAHQRHLASSRELLHQAQRKLLAMVLNGSAALVDRAIKEKLPSILPRELRPRDFVILDGG
jgi:hypothetical protein